MSVCSTNVNRAYYIHHVAIIMWPTSVSYVFYKPCPVASWDGEVLLNAHFRVSPEEAGHSGTSYSFMSTVNTKN